MSGREVRRNRHRFGRRAEALPADQRLLGLEEAEQNEAEAAAQAEAKSPPMREEAKRKRRAHRGALPLHLPEIETTVDVESKACPCCGGQLHRIGEEVSKKLDIDELLPWAYATAEPLKAVA